MLQKSLLEWMEFAFLRESLNRRDDFSLNG